MSSRLLMVLFLITVIVSCIFLRRLCDQESFKNIYRHVMGTSYSSKRSTTNAYMEGFILQADTTLRYVHPHNSSIVAAKEFKLEENAMKTARELIGDLVHENNTKPVKMENGVPFLPKLMPVTAISSNHFNELMAHITPAEKIQPHGKIVVYELGLNQQEIDHLNS